MTSFSFRLWNGSEVFVWINRLRFFFQEYKAARMGLVLKGLETVSREAHLIMEEHAVLRYMTVEPLEQKGPVSIGAFSLIRSQTRLQQVHEIGRFCSIGRYVVLGETPRNHPIDWVSTSLSASRGYRGSHTPASIGHDVWIAHNAVIMAGVKVGHGAIIGRNAVVTRDVEPYQIVAGVPARPIRYRFEEAQREALLRSEWWNLDYGELCRLPFANVGEFLRQVQSVSRKANYRTIHIRNRKVFSGTPVVP